MNLRTVYLSVPRCWLTPDSWVADQSILPLARVETTQGVCITGHYKHVDVPKNARAGKTQVVGKGLSISPVCHDAYG